MLSTSPSYSPRSIHPIMVRLSTSAFLQFVAVSCYLLGTSSAQHVCDAGVSYTNLETGANQTRIVTNAAQCDFVCEKAETFPANLGSTYGGWTKASSTTLDGGCVCETTKCGAGVTVTDSGCVCNSDGNTCTMCTCKCQPSLHHGSL